MPKYGNWFGSYPIISDNPPAIVAFLDVEAAPFKLHLDVFIALNFDTLHRQCRRRQQALCESACKIDPLDGRIGVQF